MANIPTPHIEANYGDFASTVLMPGDPLRAEFIAKEFLTDARLVTRVRNVYGYTGLYEGKPVSIMASGMGMPSMGIYSYELFSFYDVQRIIRIGTAGAIDDSVKLRELVMGIASCTNSNYGAQYGLPGTIAPAASYPLLEGAVRQARELGIEPHVGTLLCSDSFYDDDSDYLRKWQKMGVLAVEMESAALYYNAARLKKQALTIATISDAPLRGEACTAQERQTSFTQMMETALRTAVRE